MNILFFLKQTCVKRCLTFVFFLSYLLCILVLLCFSSFLFLYNNTHVLSLTLSLSLQLSSTLSLQIYFSLSLQIYFSLSLQFSFSLSLSHTFNFLSHFHFNFFFLSLFYFIFLSLSHFNFLSLSLLLHSLFFSSSSLSLSFSLCIYPSQVPPLSLTLEGVNLSAPRVALN